MAVEAANSYAKRPNQSRCAQSLAADPRADTLARKRRVREYADGSYAHVSRVARSDAHHWRRLIRLEHEHLNATVTHGARNVAVRGIERQQQPESRSWRGNERRATDQPSLRDKQLSGRLEQRVQPVKHSR